MNLGYLIRIIPFKLYFVLESITFFLVRTFSTIIFEG